MLRASTTPQGAQAKPVDSGSQRGPGLCLAEFDSPRSHETTNRRSICAAEHSGLAAAIACLTRSG